MGVSVRPLQSERTQQTQAQRPAFQSIGRQRELVSNPSMAGITQVGALREAP